MFLCRSLCAHCGGRSRRTHEKGVNKEVFFFFSPELEIQEKHHF